MAEAPSVSPLPTLGQKEIEEALKKLLGKQRRHYLFAFFGTGNEGSVVVESEHYDVVPVKSELELRMRLPGLDEAKPQRVYLVPFLELPRDLVGLFALQRVERIGKAERLASVLRVRSVDVDAARSELGEAILAGRTELSAPPSLGRVTREALFEAWLSQRWGGPRGGEFGRDALLSWATCDSRGPEFARFALTLDGRSHSLVSELEGELLRRAGATGKVAFLAWREGRGASLLEVALLAEAGATLDRGSARVHLRQRISAFGVTQSEADAVLRELGECAGRALGLVERAISPARAKQILDAADASVEDPEVRAHLATGNSARLRLGFEYRCEALAASLSALEQANAAGTLDAALLAAVHRDLSTLSAHRLSAGHAAVERAREAARLAGWLLTSTTELASGRLRADPTSDLARLGRWYAEEGGYVDRARHHAWGPSMDPLDAAVSRVRAACDARRMELDRRFARALSEWVLAGRPSKEVIPIEDALARIARPFLEEEPSRRLLVLLMDGMAWAQAVELIDSLKLFDEGWGTLYFNQRRSGESALPVVLAALPTVTHVSRSAFFAGVRMEPGKEHDTQKDPDRVRDHKALRPFFSGAAAPRLFLRADAQQKAGAVADGLITEIRDTSIRVTLAVLNTIDDSLKGNPGQKQHWSVDGIGPLRDILLAAKDAGRHVLFASDHGHVRSDGLKNLPQPSEGEGRRWRTYFKGRTAVGEHEVMIDKGGAWVPKNADGVVLLADETGRYGASTASGEHGGAALAEVIAPCVLVGWDEHGEEASTRLVPRYEPAWYRLEVPKQVQEPKVERVRKRPDSKQLEIVAVVPPKPAPVVEPSLDAEATDEKSPLAKTPLFKQQIPDRVQRAETLKALLFLKARGGSATADAFAQHMGYLPHRAAGLVSVLAERLSMDGMQPLRFDPVGRKIELDANLLRVLYGEGI